MFPATFASGAYVTLAFFVATLETWLTKLRKLHASQEKITKQYRDLAPEGRINEERARELLRPGETLEPPNEENEFTWSAWVEKPYYEMQSSAQRDAYRRRVQAIELLEDVIATAKATDAAHRAHQARMMQAQPITDTDHPLMGNVLKLLPNAETQGPRQSPALEPSIVYLFEFRQVLEVLRLLGLDLSELYAEEC